MNRLAEYWPGCLFNRC